MIFCDYCLKEITDSDELIKLRRDNIILYLHKDCADILVWGTGNYYERVEVD